MINNNNILVIYHDDCIDGLAAAWGTARALPQAECHFIGYDHGGTAKAEAEILQALQTHPPAQIFFVDVAPRPDFLNQLPQNIPITIIDHHAATAFAFAGRTFPDNVTAMINPHHPSAANMVWEYFFAHKDKPFFLTMISKMDLGQDLKTAEDFAAAAFLDAQDISSPAKAFATFATLADMPSDDIVKRGMNIAEEQHAYAKNLRNTVELVTLSLPDGTQTQIPAVMMDKKKIGRGMSQFLCALAKDYNTDVAIGWALKHNQSVSVSLRSDGKADCNAIAQNLAQNHGINGGGHKTSAALHFQSIDDFRRILPVVSTIIPSKAAKPPRP